MRRNEPEGVGHYAQILAERLASDDINTVFVAPPLRSGETEKKDEFTTIYCEDRSRDALYQALVKAKSDGPMPIFLHASAYGYQKRGVPFWLLGGLQSYLRKNHVPMATFFHELFAENKDPRTSSFWLTGAQKYIAKNLQKLSLRSLTSTSQYAQHLQSWQNEGGIDPLKLPIFSTVGEPLEVPQFAERDNTLVVFGRSEARISLYGRYRDNLEEKISDLDIEKVIDIGAPLKDVPDFLAGRNLEKMGFAEANEISAIMAHSRYGALAYPADLLCKSTIFAAHAAHGQVTFVFSDNDASEEDGLWANHNFIHGNKGDTPSKQVIADCGKQLSCWYDTHRSENVAAILKMMLFQNDGNEAIELYADNGVTGAN